MLVKKELNICFGKEKGKNMKGRREQYFFLHANAKQMVEIISWNNRTKD